MKKAKRKCTVKSRLFGEPNVWDTTSREVPYVCTNEAQNWDELTTVYGGETETFRRTLNMFDAHGTKGDARTLYNEVVAEFDERARDSKLFVKVENPDYDPNAEGGFASLVSIPDPALEEERTALAEELALKLKEVFGNEGPEVTYGLSSRSTNPSKDDTEKAAELLELIRNEQVPYDVVQALGAEYGVELSDKPVLEELALLKKVKRVADSRNVLSDFGLS